MDLSRGVASGDGTDHLQGIEDVYGSPHADVLIGMGTTRFVTGGGDDLVAGGTSGFDQLDFRPAPQGVSVDLAAGRASGWGELTITGVEDIYGSYFDDLLIGDDARNEIIGDLGTDALRGGDGRDRLFEACNCGFGLLQPPSFETNGSVRGGAGDDWVFGTNGDNKLRGGPGRDLLFGLLGDDTFNGGPGPDIAHFGGGYDRYYTNEPVVFVSWAFERSISVDLSTGVAEGHGHDRLREIERIWATDGDDTLIGDAGRNKFWGLGGNDTLSGGGGRDVLNGGPFVDQCEAQPGTRRVECEL